MQIQTHEIASRRLKTVGAIPWAQPAVIAGVPYPAFLAPKNLRRKSLERSLQSVELNQYPATPVGYYSGHYPGSTLAKANLIGFEVSRQKLPELNQYPSVNLGALAGFYPGSTIAKSNRIEYTVRFRQTPELNSRPSTPTGYYTGHYPGSIQAKQNKIGNSYNLQTVPELNRYPPTSMPAQPFTAYLAQPYTIRHESRKALSLLELDKYPQIVLSAAVLPALYNVGILNRRDIKRELLSAISIPWAQLFPAVVAVSYSMRSERIVMPPQNRDVVFARDDRSIFVGADNRGIKH